MPHVHNALHHAVALQSAFRKAVGEEDAAFSGIERAGETLTPVLNLWDRPEWALLRQEILWSAQHEQAAVAAEFGFVGVRNPADSGMLAVVDWLGLFGSAAGTARLSHGVIDATDVDGSEDIAPRDTRYPLTGVGPLVKIHGAGAAIIGNDALEFHLFPVEVPGRYHVLSPGFELRVYNAVVNSLINVTLQGYMRPGQAGEL